LDGDVREIARRCAKQVENSILEQAAKFERQAEQAGYRRLPPRLRSRAERHQAALRLYRYLIEGQDWEDIADAEAGRKGADYTPGADTVRKTATRLAEELTIPLSS